MTDSRQTERDAARRLLRALDISDEMACAQAEELLPALITAEHSGADVDEDPVFAPLLSHLDHCEHCIELYVQLADELAELAMLAEEAVDHPVPTPPTFFAPAEKPEGVVLRVIRGLIRRFELSLPVPRLAPALAVLGTDEQVPLFNDTLAQVEGSPRLSSVLTVQHSVATLHVTVREKAQTSWQVQLTVGITTYTAVTDERGVATFRDLPVEQLQNLILRCTELTALREHEGE